MTIVAGPTVTRAIHADVQQNRFRALEQPVQVFVEEDRMAIDHAQSFPHAVAEHEPAVEHRHRRLCARFQLAVDPNADVRVTRVVVEVLNALRHRLPCPPFVVVEHRV
jgi:hypothetical protein